MTLFCGLIGIIPLCWPSVFFSFAEYERGVVYNLGVLEDKPRQPGLHFFIPWISRYTVVDLRIKTLNVKPQEMMTKDSVTCSINAVVLYHISDAVKSACYVKDVHYATSLLAQTTLRAVIGESELDEVLHSREKISSKIKGFLDRATFAWGVQVDRVEVKDVTLPASMQRSMAAQAEAERERRGKIISARGELQSSEMLLQADQEMSKSPLTMQLRYMQTLTTIASDRPSRVYFPLPLSMMALAIASEQEAPAKSN